MMTTNFLIMLASIAGVVMSLHAKAQPVKKPQLTRGETMGFNEHEAHA